MSHNFSDTGRKGLTPTMLARAYRCAYAWYLECHGDAEHKIQADAGLLLQWEQGLLHEKEMIKNLPGYQEPIWDGKDWAAGYKASLALMLKGVDWIYQAVLVRDNFFGKPDLLQKIKTRSKLGRHSYQPIDLKNHKGATSKDRMQLLSYAYLLEPVLGHWPEAGGIWLSNGLIEPVSLLDPDEEFEALRKKMIALRDKKVPALGFRCAECKICPWIKVCADQWERRHCVCLVPKVKNHLAFALYDLGIYNVEQLIQVEQADLMKELHLTKKTAEDILIHAKARVFGKPIAKREFSWPKNRPIVFYDIESYGKKVYLHGLIVLDQGIRLEKSFLARQPGEEKRVWYELLDYLVQFEQPVVYTWSTYERGPTKALWEKYGGNQKGYAQLESGMQDMCKLTRDNFALPTLGYSLKQVAPFFGFHWQAQDAGGQNSQAWYEHWLNTADEVLLEKIRQYNLDDVRAMEVIFKGLENSMTKNQARDC